MNNTALWMELGTRNQKPISASPRLCVKLPMLALACAGLLAITASATLTGVTVNGVALDDDISSSGTGWSYAAYTLTLSGAGPVTLSGTNEWGMVRVVVSANVTSTVTLSNLTLRATSNNQCAFELGTNANVSLFLTGTNTLASGATQAGLAVAAGRTLSITNTPGDGAGALTVTGGNWGAGIGGGNGGAGGTVTISGGTVNISGGTVTVSGGTVTATGGLYGAGIGGGRDGNGGTVTISGGVVFTRGKDGGADIGPGSSGSVSGSNTFTGGSIRLANSTIAPAPSNGTVRVWCVTVPYLTPNAAATVNGLDPYNVNGLAADENGKLYLWLPNNVYTFTTAAGTGTMR